MISRSVRLYLTSYSILLLITLVPLIIYSQDELFLLLNNWHFKFLDSFFYWLTYLGDGIVFALIIVVLLFFSYRQAVLGLVIFLVTAGLAQLLKRVIFSDVLRPVANLGKEYVLAIPEGVTPLMNNSFPSGHTTTAFALSFFLLVSFHDKINWLLMLILALLVGYSRVYMTHHYPIDVWAGSIIGTIGAFFLYYWLDPWLNKKFSNRSILNR